MDSTSDQRHNKDWLQIWYQNAHSDLQWAKGQAWNALQWTMIVLAAVFAGSRAYTRIATCTWIVFAVIIGLVSVWWQIDLHLFARSTRLASESIVAPLQARADLLPKRVFDQHHVMLLIVRVAIVVAAATVTVIQLA